MANIVVAGTINLPPDMHWVDEFNWSPMGSTEAVGLTGALIIQTHRKRTGGRIITLQSGRDVATLSRAQLEDLEELSQIYPPEPFALVMGNGRTFNVKFADMDSKPIEAVGVQPGKVPAPDDVFIATLKFMEVPV